MMAHRIWRQRSSAEWGVRGALALAVAVLGYLSVSYTLANVVKASDPSRAHSLAPWDGRITALLSMKLVSGNPSPADRARADQHAREALREDPTAVIAVQTLATDAVARGDIIAARRLFAYSERLSRRELPTQTWAVQDAVSRGDIRAALRHYDIALRTSGYASALMFPVLASAIAEPEVRSELIRTLAARPPLGGSLHCLCGR